MKLDEKNKKQKWLNIFLVSISLLIIFNFAVGWFTWQEHWYVLPAWFFPILAGVAFPILKKTEKISKIKIIYRQDELNGREIH
jgi:hypothetical protein